MIQLYVRERCPFCKKVENAATRLGMVVGKDYQLIDASPNTPGREIVLQAGGKAMVPFLIDDAVSMYESDDIVNYLETNFNK